MKFIPLVLTVILALANPAVAQTDSGDLKSASESNGAAAPENGEAGSMNSLWTEEAKPAQEKSTSANTDLNQGGKFKSKSKAKKGKKARYNVAPSDTTATSEPRNVDANNSSNSATPGESEGGPPADTSLSSPIFVQPTSTAAGGETTITDVGGLCSINAFQSSDLLSKSAWPGVGPFTSGGENQFSDANDNKLKLFVDGDHITACELLLSNSGVANQSFLNLEMICDFMLEALGARGSKIAEFNSFMEKNKDGMSGAIVSNKKNAVSKGAKAGAGEGTLKTTAGAYAIALLPASEGPGTLLIQVTSKNGTITKGESLVKTAAAKEGKSQSGGDKSFTDSGTDSGKNPDSQSAPSWAQTSKSTNPAINSTRNTGTGKAPLKTTAVKPLSVKSSDTAAKTDKADKLEDSDSLKNELRDVVRNWQTVKKAAVKNRDTAALNTILTGNALKRQSDSIKWLVDNKQFYELTPKSVVVEKYEEISKAPRKYAVFTIVKEQSKVMKDGQAGAAKETDDTYSVKYTIERTGDHWSIADSLLLVKKK